MPRVSVIIPTYNGERFILQTIESVYQQSYQDYEIIVVDDGSTDGTRQKLQPYLARIRYVEQANQGVAAARNRGLRLAQGELIAFLDQDDLWLAEKLALQVRCFDRQPEVGIVHSGWRLVDAQANPLANIEPWQEAPVLNAAAWIRRMPVLFSAMLFRRSWIDRVNGLNPQFQQVCDVDLVQRLVLLNCPSAWVRQITTLYRQHDRNDSRNTLIQSQECWTVREQFFAQPHLPPEIRQVESESRYYTLVWLAWRLYYTGHTELAIQHLKKSLAYSPFAKTETVLHWVRSFTQYSTEHQHKLDLAALSCSQPWQRLMQDVLAPAR